ncbi:protein adenylyltransferase SelO [Marinicellulosiphila megalodicopiae]|uniref:protein adenylyltransferase SelO n=1 Tax=Marinicellulosiphila megalodicopiae TaxID=2724896 RepID=UPI003BAE41EE
MLSYRQLGHAFFSDQNPTPLPNCHYVYINKDLSKNLNLDHLTKDDFNNILSGQAQFGSSTPLAMKYCGHQFGHYNPDLGDGRGLLIAELTEHKFATAIIDLHLKGAGQTPYSRQGDGRAVLRSTLREYLMSEAMFHLNIPSSRALAIGSCPEPILREQYEPAATMIRTTACHIRFGHFEYASYHLPREKLKELANYCIHRFYPECLKAKDPYVSLLKTIIAKTAKLIAHWQAVGFNHGVMNTDNMSVLGETFDYGPFAFLTTYNPSYVCNHSDTQGRYAFDQQAQMGLFNSQCLAQAMLPLITKEQAIDCLKVYEPTFNKHFNYLFAQKLGLNEISESFIELTLTMIHQNNMDYTDFFRQLTYSFDDKNGRGRNIALDLNQFDSWNEQYENLLTKQHISHKQAKTTLQVNNPNYILHTHIIQNAIDLAYQGDYSEFETLCEVAKNPFTQNPDWVRFEKTKDSNDPDMSLSCSS